MITASVVRTLTEQRLSEIVDGVIKEAVDGAIKSDPRAQTAYVNIPSHSIFSKYEFEEFLRARGFTIIEYDPTLGAGVIAFTWVDN